MRSDINQNYKFDRVFLTTQPLDISNIDHLCLTTARLISVVYHLLDSCDQMLVKIFKCDHVFLTNVRGGKSQILIYKRFVIKNTKVKIGIQISALNIC